MKRLKIRLADDALKVLDDIGFRVFQQTGSVAVARNYVLRIRATCERIGDALDAGRSRDDIRPGMKSWSFERKAVILHGHKTSGVTVWRILHRGRHVSAMLALPKNAP